MSLESKPHDGADAARPKRAVEYGLSPAPAIAGESWLGGGMFFPGASASTPSADQRARAAETARTGESLYYSSKFDEATACFDAAVKLQPDEARYHCWLGLSAQRTHRIELAQRHIREAIRLAPDNPNVRSLVSRWCFDMGRMEEALQHSALALKLAPNDRDIMIEHAWMLQNSGDTGAAWSLIQPLVTSGIPSGDLGVLFGRIAPMIHQEAESLAFITTLLESAQIDPYWKAGLHFAAAALLDRAGRYDEAFEHARAGNSANPPRYDPQAYSRWFDAQLAYFTADRLRSLPRSNRGSRRPIFIIGMPRSGTSLVEQILASHPLVHGGGELRTLSCLNYAAETADWAQGKRYPYYLDEITIPTANSLADAYLSALAVLNADRPYVTDKMPQNFLCMGLIAVLFPDCRVIHCKRDPMDTCLSCYMTRFEAGKEYTNDLAYLGAYYRDYARFMNHWEGVLRYPLIEVQYEKLVMDLEGETRRLLELLDLPWDAQCLRYHQSRRAVRTASVDQVKQSIYTSSIGRWRHYERHLAPLIEAIEQHGPRGTQTTFR